MGGEKAETRENGIRINRKPEVRTAVTLVLVREGLELEYCSGTSSTDLHSSSNCSPYLMTQLFFIAGASSYCAKERLKSPTKNCLISGPLVETDEELKYRENNPISKLVVVLSLSWNIVRRYCTYTGILYLFHLCVF